MRRSKILIPSVLAMGFIPLIVHIYEYNTGLSQFIWYPENDMDSDLFLAWKMYAIIAVGVIMLGILLYQRFIKHQNFRYEKSFYLMLIYVCFVILSTLLSPYRQWAISGSYDMFESVWVLLAYMIFCYYTYNYVQDESHAGILLRWSGIGIMIVTLIGVFQCLGLNIYNTTFWKKLILNPSQWDNLDRITSADGLSYSTLFNSNYLSFYYGIIIPLLACLIIGVRKFWHRIVLIIAEILAVFCFAGAQSLSGWLALGISVPIMVLILLSRKKKLFIAGISITGIAIIAGIIICITTSLGDKLSDIFLGTEKLTEVFSPESIETRDDEVVMVIQGNELHIDYDYNSTDYTVTITCRDADGVQLDYIVYDSSPTTQFIADPAYLDCSITPFSIGSLVAIDVKLEENDWCFTKDVDGTFYYINSSTKLEKYTSDQGIELFGHDAFSGRGQIWNHTIPLLKNYLVVGIGANCFIFAYPQNDYIYAAYMDLPNIYDVKPHNWYLQQWIETGMIGFLALLGFYLWYVIRSIRIYRRSNLHESLSWTGIGIFSGTLTYMIVGLANDSNVCTAPVFWVILGLGMAVNRMIAEKEGMFGYVRETAEALEDEAMVEDGESLPKDNSTETDTPE